MPTQENDFIPPEFQTKLLSAEWGMVPGWVRCAIQDAALDYMYDTNIFRDISGDVYHLYNSVILNRILDQWGVEGLYSENVVLGLWYASVHALFHPNVLNDYREHEDYLQEEEQRFREEYRAQQTEHEKQRKAAEKKRKAAEKKQAKVELKIEKDRLAWAEVRRIAAEEAETKRVAQEKADAERVARAKQEKLLLRQTRPHVFRFRNLDLSGTDGGAPVPTAPLSKRFQCLDMDPVDPVESTRPKSSRFRNLELD